MSLARYYAVPCFLGALLLLPLMRPVAAQIPDDPARADTVSWSVEPDGVIKPDARIKVTLHGTVRDGWHVYSLKQAPDGPTPLLAKLEANDVAKADGAISESQPTKIQDPAFGLQTQFYEKAFTVSVPVRLASHITAGSQTIPVSVRFQTCNGRICQPPKTVHLSATLNGQASK